MATTLWAGTNSGQILVFLLKLPGGDKRKSEKVTAMLAKEIQLKHKAPVIAIEVMDAVGLPVHHPSSTADSVPHKVLIASEEQFKTFLLPMLKPYGKYKLTAHEGSRIRRIGFSTFKSKSDPDYHENGLICLTNQGDLVIQSLPDLRRQVLANCVKKEDVIAISSLVLTPKGEAFYLMSSSELQRVSVAAAHSVRPAGVLELAADARKTLDEDDEKKKEEKKQSESIKSPTLPPPSVVVTSTENGKGDAPAPATAPQNTSDPHNDTTVSEVSADITLDSVKDHTV